MNFFVKITFLFSVGSFLGWILELFFRKWFGAHNPDHRWINPGFLTGPCLPIYGFGLISLYLMAMIPVPYVESELLQKLILFIFMAITMTLLEFIAGIIFITGLHVQLWDYSKEKFNILGIICPKFSFFWAVLGGAYYFLIHPHIVDSLDWLADNMAFCLVIGFFYGILSVDIAYTFNVVTKMRAFAIEHNVLIKYESIKADIQRHANENKETIRFLLAFNSDTPLREHMLKYSSRIKNIETSISNKINSRHQNEE